MKIQQLEPQSTVQNLSHTQSIKPKDQPFSSDQLLVGGGDNWFLDTLQKLGEYIWYAICYPFELISELLSPESSDPKVDPKSNPKVDSKIDPKWVIKANNLNRVPPKLEWPEDILLETIEEKRIRDLVLKGEPAIDAKDTVESKKMKEHNAKVVRQNLNDTFRWASEDNPVTPQNKTDSITLIKYLKSIIFKLDEQKDSTKKDKIDEGVVADALYFAFSVCKDTWKEKASQIYGEFSSSSEGAERAEKLWVYVEKYKTELLNELFHKINTRDYSTLDLHWNVMDLVRNNYPDLGLSTENSKNNETYKANVTPTEKAANELAKKIHDEFIVQYSNVNRLVQAVRNSIIEGKADLFEYVQQEYTRKNPKLQYDDVSEHCMTVLFSLGADATGDGAITNEGVLFLLSLLGLISDSNQPTT